MHAKRLDPILPQDLLLHPIHIPQPNIHQSLHTDLLVRPQPAKHILALLLRQPRHKGHRHAMDIPAPAGLGRVDIGMSIHPDNRHLLAQPLADGLRRAGHGADGDGMIAAQREHEPPLPRVRVHLLADALRHRADREGALHVAILGIRRWHQ